MNMVVTVFYDGKQVVFPFLSTMYNHKVCVPGAGGTPWYGVITVTDET
jgi:hypothetical protein